MARRLLLAFAIFLGWHLGCWAGMLNTGCCAGDGTGTSSGSASVTWDPANKAAAITLTNTNATATQDQVSGTWYMVRSTTSHSSGKYYFECQNASKDGANGWMLGSDDGTVDISMAAFPGGSSGHNQGFQSDGGYYPGGSPGVWTGMTTNGHRVGIALDLTNHLAWARYDGGTWNAPAGGDPAAGTGGAMTLMSGTTYIAFAGFRSGGVSDACTLVTASSGWTDSAPAGFVAW